MMGVIFHSAVFLPMCLLLTMPTVSKAGNILFVPMFGEGSHYIAMNSIATEMVYRGHNITMLVPSHYKDIYKSSSQESYHFEVFTPFTSQETLHELMRNITSAGLHSKYAEWIMNHYVGSDFAENHMLECRSMFGDKDLMSRLRNSKYDLAFEDMNHLCPIVQYLRKNMGIPYVAMSFLLTIPGSVSLANRWPFNPSYMPEMMSASDHRMSFQERFINTGWTLIFTNIMTMLNDPFIKLRHDFGITDTTPFYDDAELFLINSHFSLDFPKPTLPNTVMVGGLTAGPGQLLDTVSDGNDFLEQQKIKKNTTTTFSTTPYSVLILCHLFA